MYIAKYQNVYSESVHIIYFIRILKKKWLCFNNNLDIKSQIFRFKFKDSKKFWRHVNVVFGLFFIQPHLHDQETHFGCSSRTSSFSQSASSCSSGPPDYEIWPPDLQIDILTDLQEPCVVWGRNLHLTSGSKSQNNNWTKRKMNIRTLESQK